MDEHEAIENKLHGSGVTRLGKYLPEFVYGGMDGCVTTFAVVAGSAGAELSTSVVLILGFANLIADGFSMSVGNYLSSKSERERYERHMRVEKWEVENMPEAETQEIREIYAAKGMRGALLEEVVATITADKKRWVKEMMLNELNMTPSDKNPVRSAMTTFLSFNLMGLIPLSVYIADAVTDLDSAYLFPVTSLLTAASFVGIGFLKATVNQKSRPVSVAETLVLGAVAATLAYFAGHVLELLLS